MTPSNLGGVEGSVRFLKKPSVFLQMSFASRPAVSLSFKFRNTRRSLKTYRSFPTESNRVDVSIWSDELREQQTGEAT